MGAHSAGRRVRAPGRYRRLNQTLEALAVTGLVGAAAFAGWVTTETPPHSPGLDPSPGLAAPLRPSDRPVPPGEAIPLPPTSVLQQAAETMPEKSLPPTTRTRGKAPATTATTTARQRPRPDPPGSCS